jgi:hypothetical protein
MKGELAALIAGDPSLVHAKGGHGKRQLQFARTIEIRPISPRTWLAAALRDVAAVESAESTLAQPTAPLAEVPSARRNKDLSH